MSACTLDDWKLQVGSTGYMGKVRLPLQKNEGAVHVLWFRQFLHHPKPVPCKRHSPCSFMPVPLAWLARQLQPPAWLIV